MVAYRLLVQSAVLATHAGMIIITVSGYDTLLFGMLDMACFLILSKDAYLHRDQEE